MLQTPWMLLAFLLCKYLTIVRRFCAYLAKSYGLSVGETSVIQAQVLASLHDYAVSVVQAAGRGEHVYPVATDQSLATPGSLAAERVVSMHTDAVSSQRRKLQVTAGAKRTLSCCPICGYALCSSLSLARTSSRCPSCGSFPARIRKAAQQDHAVGVAGHIVAGLDGVASEVEGQMPSIAPWMDPSSTGSDGRVIHTGSSTGIGSVGADGRIRGVGGGEEGGDMMASGRGRGGGGSNGESAGHRATGNAGGEGGMDDAGSGNGNGNGNGNGGGGGGIGDDDVAALESQLVEVLAGCDEDRKAHLTQVAQSGAQQQILDVMLRTGGEAAAAAAADPQTWVRLMESVQWRFLYAQTLLSEAASMGANSRSFGTSNRADGTGQPESAPPGEDVDLV